MKAAVAIAAYWSANSGLGTADWARYDPGAERRIASGGSLPGLRCFAVRVNRFVAGERTRLSDFSLRASKR